MQISYICIEFVSNRNIFFSRFTRDLAYIISILFMRVNFSKYARKNYDPQNERACCENDFLVLKKALPTSVRRSWVRFQSGTQIFFFVPRSCHVDYFIFIRNIFHTNSYNEAWLIINFTTELLVDKTV